MRFEAFAGTFVLATFLTGCASSGSTGILPAGPDTYTVTEKVAPLLGGGSKAEAVALTEANEFCAQKGRQFVPVTMSGPYQTGVIGSAYGPNSYSVTFRCLLPTDPAVAQYHPQQAPNVVIEQRNR
jgi:hypothetical protein